MNLPEEDQLYCEKDNQDCIALIGSIILAAIVLSMLLGGMI